MWPPPYPEAHRTSSLRTTPTAPSHHAFPSCLPTAFFPPANLAPPHTRSTIAMRALHTLGAYSLLFASYAHSWNWAVETGAIITCNPQCFAAYRHLIGEVLEDLNVQVNLSNQAAADSLCMNRQCSGCAFCSLVPSLRDIEQNALANAKARKEADVAKPAICMDCQEYMNECEHFSAQRENEDKPETSHRATLDCEIALCKAGPLHCRANGQCERRICKDLTARTALLPAQNTECKECVQSWVQSIHDTCLPATIDGYTDRLPSPDCVSWGMGQCEGFSWEQLHAAAAPDPACMARCWPVTLAQCQGDGRCAPPPSAFGGMGSTDYMLTPGESALVQLSRNCNRFRHGCLLICDLAEVQQKCERRCNKKNRKPATQRMLCKDDCERRTCWDECRDMTCCAGPSECRKGGPAYRCSGLNLDCAKASTIHKGIIQ